MRSRSTSGSSSPSPGSGRCPGISYNRGSAFRRNFARGAVPVLLDLTRYRQPSTHFQRTFQPSEVGGEGDAYEIVTPVDLEFDIHKDKDRFRLVGRVRAELELTCSRCAEP